MCKSSSGHFRGSMGDRNSSSGTGGLVNQLPTNDSQLKHIFRDAEGHLSDTPENRELILNVANNIENYVGNDKYGNLWYSEMQSDGTQVWVSTRGGKIQNAGKNLTPHKWDEETGYSRNPRRNGWR